ncbi:hypothetical protein MRX96_040821 [Rhipicephalus microplus]
MITGRSPRAACRKQRLSHNGSRQPHHLLIQQRKMEIAKERRGERHIARGRTMSGRECTFCMRAGTTEATDHFAAHRGGINPASRIAFGQVKAGPAGRSGNKPLLGSPSASRSNLSARPSSGSQSAQSMHTTPRTNAAAYQSGCIADAG